MTRHEDFSPAELAAMRLDGVLFAVHGAFVLPDEPDVLATRIRIARETAPPQYILDRMSAAWVWGATPLPTAVPEFCQDMAHRGTDRYNAYRSQRYVRLKPDEVVHTATGSVLSPWRTTLHLLRWTPEVTAETIRHLLQREGLTVECAIERIEATITRGHHGQFLRPLLALCGPREPTADPHPEVA